MPNVLERPPIPKPSPNFDFRLKRERVIDSIVLHDTGSNDGCGDIARFCNPESGASMHYVVDRDGRIYQLVADKDRAWHAGQPCKLHGVSTDMDERSIGIAIVNDGSGRTEYPKSQYEALKALVSVLADRHPIKLENVTCHRDVAQGFNYGPSSNFDFQSIHEAAALAIRDRIARGKEAIREKEAIRKKKVVREKEAVGGKDSFRSMGSKSPGPPSAEGCVRDEDEASAGVYG